MDNLVKSLSVGSHQVELESRTRAIDDVKRRLHDGFIFITFTETRGGTELGISIEKDLSDFSNADFQNVTGNLRIIGTCDLNYQKIRCIAEIDLSTRAGVAQVIILDSHANPREKIT